MRYLCFSNNVKKTDSYCSFGDYVNWYTSSYRCSECKSKPAPGGRVNISMSAMKYIYNIASKGYRLHVIMI